ncbi:hypothetical protein [Streptomyces sp. NPDC005141]
MRLSVGLGALQRLQFSSRASYQGEWLEPGVLLAFRAEFSASAPGSGRPIRALLLARLAVRRARFIVETARYEFAKVVDLDFAVSLNGETVYEAYGVKPMREDNRLVFTEKPGCTTSYTTIEQIVPGLKQAVQNENH